MYEQNDKHTNMLNNSNKTMYVYNFSDGRVHDLNLVVKELDIFP